MPTRAPVGAPRAAILRAATELFSQHGYDGTTIRDIAAVVGMLPGSLYAHIDTKQSLLREIVEPPNDAFLALLAEIDASQSPAQRMRAAILAHLRIVAADPQGARVALQQWRRLQEPDRGRIADKRHRGGDVYRTIVADGIADGTFAPQLDAEVALMAILGALNGTAEWLGGEDAEAIGDRLADTFLQGLERRKR